MGNIKENVHNDFVKFKENREVYFDEFYKNNYNLVYRICFSILKDKENSEDITQNVFVKILKMPIEKLPSKYESSWLYTVSKNEALQYIRSKKNDTSEEELESVKSNNNEIEDIIDDASYNEIVKNLNKKQQQIISLKIVSDFTFREIGQIMCMPTATVQWHYYSSIRYLKLALSNFAMFLITFFIGVGVINSNKSVENSKSSSDVNSKNENNKAEDNKIEGNKTENSGSEGSKDENYHITEEPNDVQHSTTDNKKHHDVDEVIQSVSTGEEKSVNEANDSLVHIGIFGIAGVFLIISIIFTIFFTNFKQKLKAKTSKNWK